MNYTELATELGRKQNTVYVRLKAMFPSRKFTISTELLPDEVSAIRDFYPSGAEVPSVEVRAERRMKKYFRQMESVESTEAVADLAAERKVESGAEAPPKKSAGWIEQFRDYVGGSDFVFLTMLVCMVAQAFHTAAFFIKVSPTDPEWVSWAFAAAVDLTALVMTMHKARRDYLIGFMVFHFVANVFVKCPKNDPEMELEIMTIVGQWVGVLVVSGILAFSNFSYTALFTTKIAKK